MRKVRADGGRPEANRHTTDPVTVPAVADTAVRPAPYAVPAPAGPSTPNVTSSTDLGPETPEPAAARPEIPTPAVVAARITSNRTAAAPTVRPPRRLRLPVPPCVLGPGTRAPHGGIGTPLPPPTH
jgi:hypothetical protein